MPQHLQRATINDVARVANVSISSVSRALNGQTTNSDTILRVQAAVAEVGYTPNAIAQSMKRSMTGAVALAVEDIGNPAYLDMVRAIQPVIQGAGLRLILHSSGGSVSEELDILAGLHQRYVDGLIICPLRVTPQFKDALESAPVPVVVIGSLPKAWDVHNVRIDSSNGGVLATEHLLQAGCRRIGFINGPRDTTPGKRRVSGYTQALESAGITPEESLIATATSFQFDDGYKAAADLLARHPEIDGLVGVNDRLAVASIHALRAQGRSVPDDVKVVGMDDSELAISTIPTLTSVNLGARQRGAIAATMLLEALRAPSHQPIQRSSVEATLTIRESST
ncbi:MAG: LacI family DNA-binding transcriptional regulator [Arachnia sp.]